MPDFARGESLLQARPASRLEMLDPRAKTLSCLLALIGVGGGLAWPVPGCLLALAGFAFSGVGLRVMLKGLRPVVFLCLFGILLHGFSTPGRAYSAWLPLTGEGLLSGARLASQLALASALAVLYVVSTPAEEIAAALSWFFAPLSRLKLPVEDFFRTVSLALAILPRIEAERASGGAVRFGELRKAAGRVSGGLRALLLEADGLARAGVSFDERAGFRRFGFGEWLAILASIAAGPAALVAM